MKSFRTFIISEKRETIHTPNKGKIPGLINPKIQSEIEGLLNKSKYKTLRFIIFKDEEEVYVWDADLANHDHVSEIYNYGSRDYGHKWDWGIIQNAVKNPEEIIYDIGVPRIYTSILRKVAPGILKFKNVKLGTT